MFSDCVGERESCKTCPGGTDFENDDCPDSSLCQKFECTKDSHCKNGGTCNVLAGKCVCPSGYVGSDCALHQGKSQGY